MDGIVTSLSRITLASYLLSYFILFLSTKTFLAVYKAPLVYMINWPFSALILLTGYEPCFALLNPEPPEPLASF